MIEDYATFLKAKVKVAAGELVFDPFAGLGTVPYCAVRLGRRGYGVELNPTSWSDARQHLTEAEQSMATPDMFELLANDKAA